LKVAVLDLVEGRRVKRQGAFGEKWIRDVGGSMRRWQRIVEKRSAHNNDGKQNY
jgi:hypothetical protein